MIMDRVSPSQGDMTRHAGEPAGAFVSLRQVTMRYQIPRRYREYLLKPFKRQSFMALNEVSLDIAKGQVLAVLGPNGSGKTTLLKLIGGLLYPTEGSVLIDGCLSSARRYRRRFKVGVVLNEERSFYWRLTGLQNLEFFGALDNLRGRLLQGRAREMLYAVGLQHAADKRVSDYSSGMRQRLGIARGLLAAPDVLILDEPTKSLDPAGSLELRQLIGERACRSSGMAVVIATHCLEEADRLGTRACILRRGRMVLDGSVQEIRAEYGSLAQCYGLTEADKEAGD